VTLAPGPRVFRPRLISTAIKVVSVAGCHSQAGPEQTIAHYWDIHFVFVTVFFVKDGTFYAEGTCLGSFDLQLWTRIGALNRGAFPGSAGVSPASSGFRPPTGRRDASTPRSAWLIQSPASWCAACCKLSNMTTEFHNPFGDRAGNGSRRFYGSNISEYFCGIFVLLCYIPAPLTNRN
jgi:hypothetical protein